MFTMFFKSLLDFNREQNAFIFYRSFISSILQQESKGESENKNDLTRSDCRLNYSNITSNGQSRQSACIILNGEMEEKSSKISFCIHHF